ncbi:hypothetical protein UQW22_09230 [Isoptericola halotolerans]|uniref:hypothetical protein n=1 Tax=Isoptericola halotolerans TaxID=300560 RepID=UPI00388E678E
MSTRDKSDFGSGKLLPDELPGAAGPDAAATADGDHGVVHPDRDWATGPDIAAAEAADRASHAHVERGAHFRADEDGDAPQEPVDPPHPPKHARSAGSA